MKKVVFLILLLSIYVSSQSQVLWQIEENFDGPTLDSRLWNINGYSWPVPNAYVDTDGERAAIDLGDIYHNISFEWDPDAGDAGTGSNVIVLSYKYEPNGITYNNKTYEFSTSLLTSVFKNWHGIIEMRAEVPSGANGNYYSSYWFYSTCKEEIDFFEVMDAEASEFKSTVHFPKGICDCHCLNSNYLFKDHHLTGYHTYTMYWDADLIALYVDGNYKTGWYYLNNYGGTVQVDAGNYNGCDEPNGHIYHSISGDQLMPENAMTMIISFGRNNSNLWPDPLPGLYKIDYIKAARYFEYTENIQNCNISFANAGYSPSLYLADNINIAGNGTTVDVGDPNNLSAKGYCQADAYNSVHIYPGFHVQPGSYFNAKIISGTKSSELTGATDSYEDTLSTVVKKIKTEIFEKGYISLAPNPAKDFVKISSNKVIKHITLTNSLGVELLNEYTNISEKQIDVSSLKQGAYFVNIVLESGSTEFKKLIVQ